MGFLDWLDDKIRDHEIKKNWLEIDALSERLQREAEEDARRREERLEEWCQQRREQEKIEQKKKELFANQIKPHIDAVNKYKIDKINKFLKTESLINASGDSISLLQIKSEGDKNIDLKEDEEIKKECKAAEDEIQEIEELIVRIDNSLQEINIAD